MNHKIIVSVVLTCLAIAVPLCLMFLQSDTGAAWDKLFYHILLLLGVGVIYWSVSLMHYMELKKCNVRTAAEKFSVLLYPMTFLGGGRLSAGRGDAQTFPVSQRFSHTTQAECPGEVSGRDGTALFSPSSQCDLYRWRQPRRSRPAGVRALWRLRLRL
jgi:hypothetical protein